MSSHYDATQEKSYFQFNLKIKQKHHILLYKGTYQIDI